MRNFFNYLKLFNEENGDCGCFCDSELRKVPNVALPATTQKNDFVREFFSGQNVCYEDISTQDGFDYRAMVSSRGACSQEEFENGINAGLKELGFNARTLVSKKRAGANSSNFLVEIHLN